MTTDAFKCGSPVKPINTVVFQCDWITYCTSSLGAYLHLQSLGGWCKGLCMQGLISLQILCLVQMIWQPYPEWFVRCVDVRTVDSIWTSLLSWVLLCRTGCTTKNAIKDKLKVCTINPNLYNSACQNYKDIQKMQISWGETGTGIRSLAFYLLMWFEVMAICLKYRPLRYTMQDFHCIDSLYSKHCINSYKNNPSQLWPTNSVWCVHPLPVFSYYFAVSGER